MAELNILVEGESEQGFVREVLAPHLSTFGVYAHAWLVGKPPGLYSMVDVLGL